MPDILTDTVWSNVEVGLANCKTTGDPEFDCAVVSVMVHVPDKGVDPVNEV